MNRSDSSQRQRGQVLVIGVMALIAMIAMAGLVLEGGNAFTQQRVVQNGADAAANAGAVVLGQRLGGATKSDTDVNAAITNTAQANGIDSFSATYTNVSGASLGVLVGGGSIPSGAQGVSVGGNKTFPTVIGQAMGFTSFTASAEATAVTGRLTGGGFLPVVIPVSVVDCETNGNLGSSQENSWLLSQPGNPPIGTAYVVPLCKTGGGSFQILDLDPSMRCDDEVADPPQISWPTLPVDVPSDNGNNCAKPIADYANANLVGKVVLIPICDNSPPDPCGTEGGSHASYRIIKVAAFYLAYLSDTNNKNNTRCTTHTEGGVTFQNIVNGNGSSSCIAGWFVRYFTAGPVGSGSIGNTDAIGIQLIK